ncbi:MAG TPA: LysR family transcriptional regulator [Nevskia sp.]|nr:LysR family transcriptional regulator [Nevskia sp.]
MNRLEAMQIYVRVAELASFTRAAEGLGLPKASISHAVQQLESALGTRLLHRTTRKVQMTQDGQAYYERCKDLLADMDELQSMFQRSEQSLRGRLRVDMPSGMARKHVVPRLPQFLDAHPQIELELSSTDRFVDVVREGFDCVVRVGTLRDSSLIARPLGSFRTISCASPAYLKRYGTPRAPQDLAHHRLIHYVSVLGAKSAGFEAPDGAGGYRNLPMAGALTVNNSEAYETACLAGLGIIQAPYEGLRGRIEAGELVEILPQHPPEPMPVSIVYAHRRNLPRRVRVFMDWVAETMRPYLEA